MEEPRFNLAPARQEAPGCERKRRRQFVLAVKILLVSLIALYLLLQTARPPGSAGAHLPRPDEPAAVYLCRRPVDDWRLQLLFPGVEHYSLWLPGKKLHRGVTADNLWQPVRWIDEIYLEPEAGEPGWREKGLSCIPAPQADPACVEQQVTRKQDEGRFGLSNHCQSKVLEVLEQCGVRIP